MYAFLNGTVTLRLREAGPAKGQQSPASKLARAVGIRQSPRLNRKRPSGDDVGGDGDGDGGEDSGTATKSGTGSKRRRPLSEAASASPLSASAAASANATPGRKRRLAAAAPGGGVPRGRARAGVLVGETPQKRPGGGIGFGGAGAGVRSSSRRGGRASRTSMDEDDDAAAAITSVASPTSPSASGSASRTSSKGRMPAEARIAGSPSLPMSSPSAGPKKRRRAIAAGPGPASPAESLFVAESPGVSTGSVRRRGRSGWAVGADGDGDGDGVSRQLMAESASPVGLGRRRGGAVVPGTPA